MNFKDDVTITLRLDFIANSYQEYQMEKYFKLTDAF